MPQSSAAKVPSHELEELRRTELEAIESILGLDFRILTPKAWHGASTSHVETYEVTLRPEIDRQKAHVAVVVEMSLTKNYPNVAPTCRVKVNDSRTRGVSRSQLSRLEDCMNAQARSLCGAEMIWELVSFGQEFISSNNQAPKEHTGTKLSLEERMRQRADAEKEDAQRRTIMEEQKKSNEESQRSALLASQIETETQKQHQAIKHQMKQLRDEPLVPPSPADDASYGEDMHAKDALALSMPILTFNERITVGDVTLQHIQRGPLLGSISIGRLYIANPITSSGVSDKLWSMEWYPISSSYYTTTTGLRKLEELERDLDQICALQHPHIVPVLQWARLPVPDTHPESSLLCIVHDHASTFQLKAMLQQTGTLPWHSVRKMALALMQALRMIHQKGITHRRIALDAILFDKDCIQFSGTLYTQRIVDLHRSNALNALSPMETEIPVGWRAPESINSPLVYAPARDIWDLGRVLCQMLFGENVLHQFASPEDMLLSLQMPSSPLRSFLERILHRSEKQRGSASTLCSLLESLQDDAMEVSPSTSITEETPRGSSAPILSLSPCFRPRSSDMKAAQNHSVTNDRIGSFWQLRNTAPPTFQPVSRYLSDFEEVEFLGKGAFGVVVKARNKLDERFYAVKKIRLSSSAAEEERTMREIMALSRLDHPHIVRYVTCWIERTAVPSLPTGFETSAETGWDSHPMTTSQQMDASALQALQRIGHEPMDDFLSTEKGSGDDMDFIEFDHDSSRSDSSDVSEDDEFSSEEISPLSHSAEPAMADSSTRVLYIQMEYVENQTLGDAIERGLSIEQAWHIFRQMLEALAHIASLGIIHRDLKPSNVLMDSHGDIKIGDFGLATTNLHVMDSGMRESMMGSAPGESTELTSGLGTFSYIAPEVLSKQGISTRYNQKVDMFSLGIIFFEMLASQRCYTTTMERYQLLRDLRLPSIMFPKTWDATQLSAQTEIIRQLLNHNPAERPTPMAMLRSPLLPPKMEDEFVQELVRLAANPSSVHRHELIHALFSRPQTDVLRDFTFDTGAQGEEDDVLVGVVTRHLRELFYRRGAVPLHPPLLFPANDVYSAERHLVKMLDKTGNVVYLPYDLTVPFARICARSGHTRFKRFDIGDVYRENVLAGGQPRAILAASYDIVSQEMEPASEAEILSIMDDLLRMPGLAGEAWVLELSHETLLRAFLDRFPARFHATLISALPALLTRSTEKRAKQQLSEAGLTSSQIDEIDVWKVRGELTPTLEKLAAIWTSNERALLSEPMAYLTQIVRLASQFGVRHKIHLVPLLSHSHTHYRNGAMMAVCKLVNGGKHRDVLAIGGRYDELLHHFAYPRTGGHEAVHAVGIQLAVGKLVKAIAKYQEINMPRFLGRPDEERTLGPWTPRRCECYIAASQSGLMEAKIQICANLWSHGISADLQYENAAGESPEHSAAMCRAEGILFLVLVRAHSPILKVKEVISRAEHEVAKEDLPIFLHDRIARQRRLDQTATHTRSRDVDGGKSASATKGLPNYTAPISARSHAHDVHLVLPHRTERGRRSERRMKPTARHAISDRAGADVMRLADALQSGSMPIVAVEISPSLLDRFARVALAPDDVLKSFLNEEKLSSDEREYLRMIHSYLQNLIQNDTSHTHSIPQASGGAHVGASSNAITGSAPRAILYAIKEGRIAFCL